MKVSGSSKTTKAKIGGAMQSPGGAKGGAVGAVDSAGGVPATFSEIADDMETRQLLAELDNIGTRLSRFPTTVLMGRYRELVGMLLQKVRSGTQIKRDFKWRRTERSMFITIERTEGLLDELDEVLAREADRTRLLSLIDEIKGCLISLLF